MQHLIGSVASLDNEQRLIASVGGREIVVFRHKDKLYALDNTCLHMGGPVGQGLLLGRVEAVVADDGTYVGERFSDEVTHIVCPWHGWEYDIDTGGCAALPHLSIRKYDVEVEGDDLYVRIA